MQHQLVYSNSQEGYSTLTSLYQIDETQDAYSPTPFALYSDEICDLIKAIRYPS